MHTDTTQTERYFQLISTDFVKIANQLQVAASCMIQDKYMYPVFLVSKEVAALGILLVKQGEGGNQWHYHATYLAVLVQCTIVAEQQVDAFIAAYPDPSQVCCLLVVAPDFTNFLYVPYPTY